MSEDRVQKNRKLGTRSLARVARQMAAVDGRAGTDGDGFLPTVERMDVEQLLDEAGIARVAPTHQDALVFPGPSTSGGPSENWTCSGADTT
ncbi:hypothetical protein B0H12DRAFT_1239144 [Mycena haematopus]|nr:hypothetical protein B0H12DRAFT_1239144 [Mycena haematopus]